MTGTTKAANDVRNTVTGDQEEEHKDLGCGVRLTGHLELKVLVKNYWLQLWHSASLSCGRGIGFEVLTS